jgi:ATP-dependent Clp protease ATP-binding subunit ClpC
VHRGLSTQGLEALRLAEDEARAMAHGYLGTEHLLLGLLAQKDTAAATTLHRLAVQPVRVRLETERLVGPGEGSGSGSMPLTPLATRALERASAEAEAAGRELANSEDLLVSLTELRECLAARILARMELSPDHIRTELGSQSGPGSQSSG